MTMIVPAPSNQGLVSLLQQQIRLQEQTLAEQQRIRLGQQLITGEELDPDAPANT